jgi:5-methylcytosine-specific restriction endonuclease McrA
VQFTADQALSDKLREARDLLRHQVPDGSLAAIVERAVDLLLREVKKDRFGVGRVPKTEQPEKAKPGSRHVPDAIKRQVYERDGGQCTFTDERGHRCPEKGWLELDHVRGFARDPTHAVEGLRLLCKAHNAFEAERLYGATFMEEKRRSSAPASRPGTPLDHPLRLL